VIVQGLDTVILNVQLPWFPDVSVAVQVTVVIPTGKQNPDAGVQTVDCTPQLSLLVGAG
jgi:hypothetical protein